MLSTMYTMSNRPCDLAIPITTADPSPHAMDISPFVRTSISVINPSDNSCCANEFVITWPLAPPSTIPKLLLHTDDTHVLSIIVDRTGLRIVTVPLTQFECRPPRPPAGPRLLKPLPPAPRPPGGMPGGCGGRVAYAPVGFNDG